MLPPALHLDLPAPCQQQHSVTCAWVYDGTHNAKLGHLATWLIGKPLAIIGLIVLAVVLRWIANRIINRLVQRAEKGTLPGRAGASEVAGSSRRVQRARSLGSLLRSLSTGVIFGVIFVMILAQVGVNVAPILASAGVLGLALGFGAQELVKDLLSGIALTLEDQYGVGDSINLVDVSGTVEAIGLRVTRLRDVDGTVWYVRNGEILRVGNQSQNWARTVLDISVTHDADLGRVREVLKDLAHQLWEEPDYEGIVLEEPEVWGVQSMTPEGIVIRLVLKTAPNSQWAIAREMRARIKARFDTEGIRMPVAQMVAYPQNGAPA